MKSQNFDWKYLENGDRYEVRPRGTLTRTTNRLSIGTVTFDLDDLEGSKIKVILFDVKYVKNGNCHGVGPNGDYTVCP